MNTFDKLVVFSVVIILFVGFGDLAMFELSSHLDPLHGGFWHYLAFFALEITATFFEGLPPYPATILSTIILVPYIVFKLTDNLYLFYFIAITYLLTITWVYNVPVGNGQLTSFEIALIITIPQVANLILHFLVKSLERLKY